jgi:nitrogen fixation/metabolism regulation signal transduction histidine kinase
MTPSVPPAPVAPSNQRSIKNYLLDARFQLKWTGRILFVALGISLVMGSFLHRTSGEVIEQSEKVIAAGDALARESQKNSDLVRMQIKGQYADAPELAASFNAVAGAHDRKLIEQREQLERHAENTKRQQRNMILALVVGLSVLVVLIGLLGIYFTHKVVGPIYKMKQLLKQVGDGKLIFHGKLRKGDELQDFFDVFAAMVEKLKTRQAAEVELLSAAIDEAKAAGASDEVIDKVARVRDEMKGVLEH